MKTPSASDPIPYFILSVRFLNILDFGYCFWKCPGSAQALYTLMFNLVLGLIGCGRSLHLAGVSMTLLHVEVFEF